MGFVAFERKYLWTNRSFRHIFYKNQDRNVKESAFITGTHDFGLLFHKIWLLHILFVLKNRPKTYITSLQSFLNFFHCKGRKRRFWLNFYKKKISNGRSARFSTYFCKEKDLKTAITTWCTFLAYFIKKKLKMAVTHVFGLFFFVFYKKKVFLMAKTYVFSLFF